MFKKLRSKRDPGVTVFQELRKEFGHYFKKAEARWRALLQRYPRAFFLGMLLMMLFSFVVNVWFHTKPQARQLVLPSASFSGMAGTASAIRQTIALKAQVDTLLHKPVLSHSDSISLNQALDSLLKIKP